MRRSLLAVRRGASCHDVRPARSRRSGSSRNPPCWAPWAAMSLSVAMTSPELRSIPSRFAPALFPCGVRPASAWPFRGASSCPRRTLRTRVSSDPTPTAQSRTAARVRERRPLADTSHPRAAETTTMRQPTQASVTPMTLVTRAQSVSRLLLGAAMGLPPAVGCPYIRRVERSSRMK